MKNKLKTFIKKWLGIPEIIDGLNKDIERKLATQDFSEHRAWTKRNYADCFTCGVRCLKSKMKRLAVFENDLPYESVLTQYSLDVAIALCSGDHNKHDNDTKAIFFCTRCEAQLPKKLKTKTYFSNTI